ncbi:MAG TPA: DinB family protein [Micromonosporaceae bacterium]|nr:DinB family protein [Micromonosporaceae bacterium]
MTKADSPLSPEERVATAGERAQLEAFLDSQRREVVAKVAGLSNQEIRRRLVVSMTTPGGLLKHLAAVERSWFQRRLAQRPPDQIDGYPIGDDGSWAMERDTTLADLVAEYEAACAESRRVAAGFELDHAVTHPRLGQVSLRWIYLHMIEETARHAGHADILREQIDAE